MSVIDWSALDASNAVVAADISGTDWTRVRRLWEEKIKGLGVKQLYINAPLTPDLQEADLNSYVWNSPITIGTLKSETMIPPTTSGAVDNAQFWHAMPTRS